MPYEKWEQPEEDELERMMPRLGIFDGVMTCLELAKHMADASKSERWRFKRQYTAISIMDQICHKQARGDRIQRTANEKPRLSTNKWVYGGTHPLTGKEVDRMLVTRAALEKYENSANEKTRSKRYSGWAADEKERVANEKAAEEDSE